MKLNFELPSKDRELEAKEYIKEFIEYGSDINGTGGLDVENYDKWLAKTLNSHQGIEKREGKVPASTFFVIESESNIIVGMVNIRHRLNDYLINSGSGHIGYSVRPNERRKGYATEILRKALIILKNVFNVEEVFVGCNKDNIGSKKTIMKNRGVLFNEITEEDRNITLEYIIKTEVIDSNTSD